MEDFLIWLFLSTSGFKLGSLLVRYLGVPLITGHLIDRDCRPLIEKITSCIDSWVAKKPSYARRL